MEQAAGTSVNIQSDATDMRISLHPVSKSMNQNDNVHDL